MINADVARRLAKLNEIMVDDPREGHRALQPGVVDRVCDILAALSITEPLIFGTAEGGIQLAWPWNGDTDFVTITVQPDNIYTASFDDVYLEEVEE